MTEVNGGFVRNVSALAITFAIHALPAPFATLSFAASRCPPRQPIASVGLLLLQFMALKTFVAFVKVSTL